MTTRPHYKLHAFIIFVLAVAFIFYKYLLEVSPGVMGPNFMRFFNINGADLGNVVAFYYYAYLLMQIPTGVLLDQFGPRIIMTIAIFLCALGAFLMSRATALPSLCFGRFIIGIGAAASILGAFKLLTLWFPIKRFAVLAGLMMSVGISGAVLGQRPLANFVAQMGWRTTLLYLAIIGLVFIFIFYSIVKDNGPYKHSIPDTTEKPALLSGLISVLKSKQTWVLSIYSGLAFAPITTLGGLWGVPFLRTSFGLNSSDAAQAISMIFIGFAIGSPLAGWLSDYIGKRKPIMVIGTSLSLLVLIIIVLGSGFSFFSLELLLFLFGLFTTGFIVSFTMIREVNPILLAATALGFMNSFNAALAAFADPLLGSVLDSTSYGHTNQGILAYSSQSFEYANLTLVAYLALAVIISLFVKETHCKQIE